MAGPRVFVSHSHIDTSFANRLVADLRAGGADVWVDVVNINRGDFQERINDALGACQYFVLVLTPEALASPWVRMETNAAIKRKMQGQLLDILPVVARPVDPQYIPPTWDTFQRFDAVANYPAAVAGVLHALSLQMPQMPQMPQAPQISQVAQQPQLPYVQASQPHQATYSRRPGKQHSKNLPWIIASVVLVIVILLLCGSIAIFLFTNIPRASDQTSAAAQVALLCADLESQDYNSAYQVLSMGEQSRISQSDYAANQQALVASEGAIVTCQIDPNNPLPDVNGSAASAQVQVARGDNSKLVTGTVRLVKDNNQWKIDSADSALKLL